MNNNLKAMRYIVIRFMPYIQTREFANIGIILACPETGYFGYKINHKYAHLSKFFRHFEAKIYHASIRAFKEELDYIQGLNLYGDSLRGTIEHIARPREAILSTSKVGFCLAADEKTELERLFDYYIGHSFAQNTQEKVLLNKIQKEIQELNLAEPFKEAKIGHADQYQVNFPMVQFHNDEARKIIKPIYLGQDNSSEIYEKADRWQLRFNRLRNMGLLKGTEILMPYQINDKSTPTQNKALSEVLQNFEDNDIIIVSHQERQKIIDFAM